MNPLLSRDGLRRTVSALLLSLVVATAGQAQAPGQRSALPPQDCDRACLVDFLRQYMAALARRDASVLPVDPALRFTENNVELPFGQAGAWLTATGVAATGLEAADVQQGEAAWIGAIDEHGAPIYFGVRLQVRDRRITEVETVAVRNSGLPLPFGDFSKLVHDEAFTAVLPEAQRRPRERLRAVADSYFNTVELNDGMVFAPFDAECGRIENGIHTTAAGAAAATPGQANAASISPGCEAQFKLGIYYINKRIRERRYPIIDEERGVVVATGFFDHANGFDRYRLTDGREMRTALKWPNSISLIEAFKIVSGRIYRIETVFSYVPYFMPSPFYLHPVPPPAAATPAPARRDRHCDAACLSDIGDRFMESLATRQAHQIPWAASVGYTENGVRMTIGDGLWASIRRKSDTALHLADERRGSYAWYGLVYDHDAPAYAGVRLRIVDRKVAEVEVLVARERNPGPWLAPAQYVVPTMATATASGVLERQARSCLAPRGCATGEGLRHENGQPLRRVLPTRRDVRVVAVDAAQGRVALISQFDEPLRAGPYRLADGTEKPGLPDHPLTRSVFEVWQWQQGQWQRVDAVSVFQPFGMPSGWE
jgi:hypothetical protein